MPVNATGESLATLGSESVSNIGRQQAKKMLDLRGCHGLTRRQNGLRKLLCWVQGFMHLLLHRQWENSLVNETRSGRGTAP